jgi:small subunit ribosomal protein S20
MGRRDATGAPAAVAVDGLVAWGHPLVAGIFDGLATAEGRLAQCRPRLEPGRLTAGQTPGADDVANIKSQKKRILTNAKRQERNKSVKSELKTRVKQAVRAIDTGGEEAADAVRLAVKRLDKAATKGVIHKNAAARRKSRLMRRQAAES